LLVDIDDRQDAALDADGLEALALFVLARLGLPETAELSLSFVGLAEIRRLNCEYRGIDEPTDVLSFECDSPDEATDGQPLSLGDVVIAPAVAAERLGRYDRELPQALELLLVHGILHLSGYDHQSEADAQAMEATEDELLEAWAANKGGEG